MLLSFIKLTKFSESSPETGNVHMLFTDVLQIHVNMKGDASSPGMTSSVCVRTQATKEKCVTCVCIGCLTTTIFLSFKYITPGPSCIFPNNNKRMTLLVKQRFIKNRARRTDSVASTGLETTPLILISVGRWNHLRCTAKWSVSYHCLL